MAKQFGSPVSDSKESSMRASAVPTTTKAFTELGIRVWNEWASILGSSGSTDRSPVDTPLLEMPLADPSYWMGSLFSIKYKKRMGWNNRRSLCTLSCPALNVFRAERRAQHQSSINY